MSKSTPCKHRGCTKFCDTTKGGARGLCRDHYRQKFRFIKTRCIDCHRPMRVRGDAAKINNGRCRLCANKEVANRPEVKAKRSEDAKKQVLAQGGIPNAVHITRENCMEYISRVKYRKLTPEERRKRSLTLPHGPKHHNWKGGITSENMRIRHSVEYKIWRRAVFTRDNWTCVLCGVRSKPGVKVYLSADHIKPFAKFPELRFIVSNGRTLCWPCHMRHHHPAKAYCGSRRTQASRVRRKSICASAK